jgi:hypothetical protein
MKMRNVLFVLTASIGLAACFTSDEPLITDEMAVAPYARITYVQEGTDEQQVLIRDGNGNAVEGEPGSAMRFAPVADNLYVAQATSDDAGKAHRTPLPLRDWVRRPGLVKRDQGG